MLRCLPAYNNFTEARVFTAWVPQDQWARAKGLVVFMQEQLPEHWTYIVVLSKSKSGNAVFGKAVCGKLEELLAVYGRPKDDIWGGRGTREKARQESAQAEAAYHALTGE